MFKIFKRFIAYFIDMMVVLIIVQTISSIPFVNKDLDKYNEVYDEYMETTLEYGNFKVDLDKYYEDKKITEKEYDKILSDYPGYEYLLDKYYKDGKLSSKNYDKLVSELDDTYLTDYEDVYYKIDKYSYVYNICYVIVTILYFVGFNMITNGVTLGKKLVRLKIINNKDSNSKVGVSSYLIRCVMVYQIIYYLFKVIFINVLSVGDYYTVSNIVYDIHTYLLFIILMFASIRLDGRGLHDIVANTRVIEVDKNGNFGN